MSLQLSPCVRLWVESRTGPRVRFALVESAAQLNSSVCAIKSGSSNVPVGANDTGLRTWDSRPLVTSPYFEAGFSTLR